MIHFLISIFFLTLLPPASLAGTTQRGEKQSGFIQGASEGLGFRLFVPATATKPSEKKTFPLVVFLHGVGERGTDNKAQIGYNFFSASTGVMARAQEAGGGAFILAPQVQGTDKWIQINQWNDPQYKFSKNPTPSMASLIKLLKKIISDYPIDQNRVYLTGLSMGAFGVFDLLAREHQLFAAAIAVCGRGDPKMVERFASVPVYLVHGDKDKLVSVEFSREMNAALNKSGSRSVLKVLPGVGHNAWDVAFASDEIADWLFVQRLGVR